MTDFGLARRMQSRGDDFTVLAPEATVVMGTFGYVAPEYARTGDMEPVTELNWGIGLELPLMSVSSTCFASLLQQSRVALFTPVAS